MPELSQIPVLEPGVYEHYKGNKYEVLSVGRHTETGECFVVYKPLYEHNGQPDIWLRPYDMFVESVVVNGVTVPRFAKVDGS